MAVTPKMILGDPITGFGGSSLRQAYAIFNEHTHGRVAGSCYAWGLRVGMTVSAGSENGQNIFSPNTRIIEVGPDFFRVDTPLYVAANNLTVVGTLTVANPYQVIQTTVEGCRIDLVEQVVKVPPTGGEVPPSLARVAEMRLINGTFNLHQAQRDFVYTNVIYDVPGPGENPESLIITPVPYAALMPILVNPPVPLALYELSGMVTHPYYAPEPPLQVRLSLRKNVREPIEGSCLALRNFVDNRSTYRYSYTRERNITLRRGDVLWLVGAMVNEQPIPPDLYLHYTLSVFCLDEPL